MKVLAALFMSLFSFSPFAHHEPISDFGQDSYLGGGYFIDPNGEIENYHVLLRTESNLTHQTIVIDDLLYIITGEFNFNSNNRFDVTLTKFSGDSENDPEKKDPDFIYIGTGYCFSLQCHLSAATENGYFEETITIDHEENTIYKIGSSTITQPEMPDQVTTWEEVLVKIHNN